MSYLGLTVIEVTSAGVYHINGSKSFTLSATFMWIVLARTKRETKINTFNRNISSISEVSFCLN